MLQEQLPLRLERVVRALPRGDVQPAVAKPQRVGQIGIPDGPRCIHPGLGLALAQARDRAARGAIHLQHEQLVPVDADGPRRVDLRDDAARELERRIGRVFGRTRIRVPALVDTLGNMRCAHTGDGAHRSNDLVEHVAPVAEHIDDDAATFLAFVVPGGALEWLHVLEHPVAEFTAHGQDAPEVPTSDQPLELDQARQEELVLNDAVLHAGALREPRQPQRRREVGRGGFLAVDVLAGADRRPDALGPPRRHLGVEVHGVRGIGQAALEVGAPALDLMLVCQSTQLVLVPAHEDGVRQHRVAVRQADASLLTDGDDGAREVLVSPHPSGDPVHDDADGAPGHYLSLSCARRATA